MFLDASAMVAIIAMEDDAASLTARLGQARKVHTSAVAVFETAAGLARIANAPVSDALAVTERFLGEINAEVVPIGTSIAREAVAAFARYGRGRHRAALNMGDCFAYACARSLGVPLLFKGNDFTQTDIAIT
jgi:ribonuclease VapC